jgi:hypothetical protein
VGPQGSIDEALRIDQCDLFVGIFWNRIGSPTKFGKTGTEHEFQTAYKAWKRNKSPDIMFYFNEKPSTLTSAADLDQRGKVLEFKRTFPEEGLYWVYRGHAEFVKFANEHLRKFIHEYVARRSGGQPKSRRPASKGKSKPAPDPGNTFTLRVGSRGALRLPPALLKTLSVSEGDHLEVRVDKSRIVSGVGVPKDQPFDAKVKTRLTKGLNSSGGSVTPFDLRRAIAKGKRNG